ncbi:MAG: alpha/beta hydrolase [Ignavibacteriales bacterium]|nr:MAG: alpha/beta hydrolase [Ignavibacteriales bacterium]
MSIKNSKLAKRWIIILVILLLILLIGYLVIEYAAQHILAYSPIRPARCTKESLLKYNNEVYTPDQLNLRYEDFNITVEDTIRLKGWFIFSNSVKSKGTIFLLHGIASCKSTMLKTALLLTASGFNCVVYDSRANGESGGVNCTFGYYEKKDLSAYLDSLQFRYQDSGPYGAFGNSLGAAVLIQTMAEDKRIICGIAESPFANLREIIHDYFSRMYYLRINWIPDKALEYSEKIANFKVDSVDPSKSAKNITQPIMIVHGLRDEHISYKYGEEIFENIKSKVKVWYPIEDGEHNNLSQVGGVKLNEAIATFFNKHLVLSFFE